MLEFIIVTPLAYLMFYIFIISKYDKNGKLKEKKGHKLLNKAIDKGKNFLFGPKDEKEEVLLRGRKNKKVKEEKEDFKLHTEVAILVARYKIDLSKINYKKLLKMVYGMCSIDIGLILGIVVCVPANTYIQILCGGILMIPIILISYSILGKYLIKKGYQKKEEKKKGKNKNV